MKNSNIDVEDNVISKNNLVGLLCRDKSVVNLFENNFDENNISLLIEGKSTAKKQNIDQMIILGEKRYYQPSKCRIF
jgi:hypothetical protein